MTVEENGASFIIPTEMEAIRYNNTIKDFSLVTMPVPTPKPHEVVIKGTSAPNAQPSATINPPSPGSKVFTDAQTNPVKSCGICGTDLHIHNGDFASKTPVVTGHETSGIVVKIGEAVKDFKLGDKVTADNSEVCGYCHFCRRGSCFFAKISWLMASSVRLYHHILPPRSSEGCVLTISVVMAVDDGFAEYSTFHAEKLFPSPTSPGPKQRSSNQPPTPSTARTASVPKPGPPSLWSVPGRRDSV